MSTPSTHRSHKRSKAHARVENTTDSTRGEPLAVRAQIRKAELEKLLALVEDNDHRARADIEMALAEVDQWLAGDVERVSNVTGTEISRWLEATKHLAETTPKAKRTRS